MIDATTIQTLEGRIGFGSDAEIGITVLPAHVTGTSERSVPYFHKLATLENLYNCIPKIDMIKNDFDSLLAQYKKDAVRSALTSVMHQSKYYKEEVDYSATIIEKIHLFDEVIGYNLAVTIIEQLVSSPRINDTERNANQTYEKLKIELEGVKNASGYIAAQGIQRKLRYSARKARRIIFPKRFVVNSKKVW